METVVNRPGTVEGPLRARGQGLDPESDARLGVETLPPTRAHFPQVRRVGQDATHGRFLPPPHGGRKPLSRRS